MFKDMTDNELKCPCKIRIHMEQDDCDRTECDKCCPLAQEESEDDTE